MSLVTMKAPVGTLFENGTRIYAIKRPEILIVVGPGVLVVIDDQANHRSRDVALMNFGVETLGQPTDSDESLATVSETTNSIVQHLLSGMAAEAVPLAFARSEDTDLPSPENVDVDASVPDSVSVE